MEERIIKLYSKINCGLMPDIRGGVIVYFQFVKSFLLMLSSNLEYGKSRDCSRSILEFQV